MPDGTILLLLKHFLSKKTVALLNEKEKKILKFSAESNLQPTNDSKGIFSPESTLKEEFVNDIYGNFQCYPCPDINSNILEMIRIGKIRMTFVSDKSPLMFPFLQALKQRSYIQPLTNILRNIRHTSFIFCRRRLDSISNWRYHIWKNISSVLTWVSNIKIKLFCVLQLNFIRHRNYVCVWCLWVWRLCYSIECKSALKLTMAWKYDFPIRSSSI